MQILSEQKEAVDQLIQRGFEVIFEKDGSVEMTWKLTIRKIVNKL